MVRAIAAFMIMLTCGCRQEVTMLTQDQLAALLEQDRQITLNRAGVTGTAHVNADQSFFVEVPRLGRDTGIWWQEGDRICSRWKTFRKDQNLCAVVGQVEDGTYRGYTPGRGSYLGEFTLLP
ncbi:hypothetical protein J7394_06845 [Ruegeria sp. R13_0]|uniref:hypothetical protein n=1 Tax=Ruegeria sp. R13_0 TaxID=2821099 RepID=UPI001ADAF05F|nr:hypothetical protein [Ruegeria sp. R13_0]MBO9433914.1 hypothetical protein [Ruegeria sp. R13_0]